MTVLHITETIHTEQCTTPSSSSKSHKMLETTHSRTMTSFGTPFSPFICMRRNEHKLISGLAVQVLLNECYVNGLISVLWTQGERAPH